MNSAYYHTKFKSVKLTERCVHDKLFKFNVALNVNVQGDILL